MLKRIAGLNGRIRPISKIEVSRIGVKGRQVVWWQCRSAALGILPELKQGFEGRYVLG